MTSNPARDLESQIRAVKPGDHICLVYQNAREQLEAVIPFIQAGLAAGERCGYLVDERSAEEILTALAAAGVDVEREIQRGALVLLTSRDAYLRDGHFDPHAMGRFLAEGQADALAAGFAGFRVTGEMTWALGPETGCDRLIEYEAILNEFFPGSHSLAICQYNRERFPAEVIRDVLRTHPVAIVDGKVCSNPYYESPELALGKASAEQRVDWMIANLHRTWENELVRAQIDTRLRLERELRDKQILLERIIDHVPAGLSYIDRNLVYQWVNPAQADMWKVRAEDVLGKTVYEAFGPETDAQIGALLRQVLDTGQPYHDKEFAFHYTMEGRDDTSFWDFSYIPVFGQGPDPDGIMVLAMEVSERAEKAKLQREKIDALEQADVLKDQFISILSHELRTPINAITGFGTILSDGLAGDLTPEQQTYLSKMLAGADTLLLLVEDLLDMSRIQAGQFRLSPQPMSLAAVVQQVAESLAGLAEKKHQTLSVELPVRLPDVVADSQRVQQVLINLVNNAIKFTPGSGTIRIRVREDGGALRCEVADSGIGIAPEDQSKLFKPFTQLDMSSTRAVGGTGLGLSICKALVEAHDGAVGLQSDGIGKGSTFWFTLPVKQHQALGEPISTRQHL